MIHQFTHRWEETLRFWVNEKDGRKAILGRNDTDKEQLLAYQTYRLGVRAIGRPTDSRTLIVGPIPKNIFCGNSILVLKRDQNIGRQFSDTTVCLVQGLLNSMTIDYYIRQMVSANLNMFFIYQLPVPRLTEKDDAFRPIMERAARLICTTSEFDDLAKEIFGKKASSRSVGITDPADRMRLRAELDALIAQLYGLTEEEFAYILITFPLVDESVKQLTLNTFRDLQRLGKLSDTRL
jgi:hypothetical protein